MRPLALSVLLVTLTACDVKSEKDPVDTSDSGDPAAQDLDQDGWTTVDDCDDEDPAVHPEADERCNEIDDDCDGDTDEDATDAAIWYADADADGFGDASETVTSCAAPSGYLADATDCDDADPGSNPDADEVCDQVDNDCDGAVDDEDDSVEGTTSWYGDLDGDGFGDPEDDRLACDQPEDAVADDQDCDDQDDTVYPGAEELCDGVDSNCDGEVDEGVVGSGDACPAESCAALLTEGEASGAFWIDPDGSGAVEPFEVYCDQATDDGGWTLVLKTDRSSNAHNTSKAVSPEELATADLDTVAKLQDAAIQALQAASTTGGEVRIVADGTADNLIVKDFTWSVDMPSSYSNDLLAKMASDKDWSDGFLCYDSDGATSPGCTSDHFCFGIDDDAHACVRRWSATGIWLNYGIYSGTYYEATIWVR